MQAFCCILNLFFVIVCKLSVAGVGIATVVCVFYSQQTAVKKTERTSPINYNIIKRAC